MALNHFVPAGKVLKITIGGYRFVGPVQVKLSGNMPLPKTYEDGTSTSPVSEVKPITSEIDSETVKGLTGFAEDLEETLIDCTEDDES